MKRILAVLALLLIALAGLLSQRDTSKDDGPGVASTMEARVD